MGGSALAYQYLLFDLDGTLTDSGPGIMNAAAYALEKMGVPVGERALLKRFVGPPLNQTFHNLYGIPWTHTMEAILHYRHYYNEMGGIFENQPYPGIHQLLAELKAEGNALLVATSKPLPMAQRVLDYYNLTQYFDFVFGGTLDESGCIKSVIVGQAVEACGLAAKGNILMIGDREHDVIGAHENGLPCVGVLWGYGSREELESAKAEYIAEDYEQLKAIIHG